MKKLALVAALALASCNNASTIQTIGQVAAGSLPAACAAYNVAKGYFTNVLAVNTPANISIGTAANAIATGICPPNPAPTNITAALADLNAAWVALQAATTVPPTPSPSPSK